MPALFASNPLYARLTRDAKGPSVRVTVWLAGMLAVIGVAISIFGLLIVSSMEAKAAQLTFAEWQIMRNAFVNMLFVLLGLFLIGPLGVGIVCALQTSRDVQSKEYSPRHLPSITRAQVVQGYVYAGLYHVRLLLALVVGLTPIMVGGLVYFTLSSLILMHPVSSLPFYRISEPYHLTFVDVIGALATISGAAIGSLALNPLAAVLGTALALRRSNTGTAIVLTAIITLLGGFLGVIVLLTLIGPTVGGAAFSQYSTVLQAMGSTIGLCVLPTTLLTLGTMAIAGWWSKRSRTHTTDFDP